MTLRKNCWRILSSSKLKIVWNCSQHFSIDGIHTIRSYPLIFNMFNCLISLFDSWHDHNHWKNSRTISISIEHFLRSISSSTIYLLSKFISRKEWKICSSKKISFLTWVFNTWFFFFLSAVYYGHVLCCYFPYNANVQ